MIEKEQEILQNVKNSDKKSFKKFFQFITIVFLGLLFIKQKIAT